MVLRDEDAQAFAALEDAVLEELAPEGTLQRLLAGRIVRAAWRLERAERIETEMFAHRRGGEENLALALIRDGNGTRAFDTLLRYRGSALAELFRALRLLQALQGQARANVVPRQARANRRPRNQTNPKAAEILAKSRRPNAPDTMSRAQPLVGAEVTRQTLLPTSSATSSAPWRSIATPTGRPARLAVVAEKPGQHVDRIARRPAVLERHEDHLVAAAAACGSRSRAGRRTRRWRSVSGRLLPSAKVRPSDAVCGPSA